MNKYSYLYQDMQQILVSFMKNFLTFRRICCMNDSMTHLCDSKNTCLSPPTGIML